MAIKINFVENLNEMDNFPDKEAHELIIVACVLALTEITQQINRVLGILKTEQEETGIKFVDVMNNVFSGEDKELLIRLCNMHGENLTNFALALESEPESINSKFTASVLDNIVKEFSDSDYVIVNRYMESILDMLKNDPNA